MDAVIKILAYAAFMAFSWIVFRLIVRRDYLKYGRLSSFSAFLEVLVFFFHGVLAYLHMPAEFPAMPPLEPHPVLNVAALVLIGFGLVGVLAAMSRLGFGVSVGQQAGGVHKSGLYAVTRNPQIVFYTLVVLGYALLWTNWLTLLWVAVYFFAAHLMVLTEEEYLASQYGKDYHDYRKDVPRYLFGRKQ